MVSCDQLDSIDQTEVVPEQKSCTARVWASVPLQSHALFLIVDVELGVVCTVNSGDVLGRRRRSVLE